jgi:hypothetical protein
MIKMSIGRHVKYPLFLSDFNETCVTKVLRRACSSLNSNQYPSNDWNNMERFNAAVNRRNYHGGPRFDISKTSQDFKSAYKINLLLRSLRVPRQ